MINKLVCALTCNPLWRLTTASTKMYFRNFTAVFFSLLFPIIFLIVFGVVSSGNSMSIDIAYINQSDSAIGRSFDEAFSGLIKDSTLDSATNNSRLFNNDTEIKTLADARQYEQAIALARTKLADSELTTAVIVPADFGQNGSGGQVQLLINAANGQFVSVVQNVLDDIVSGFNNQLIAEQLGGTIPQPFSYVSEDIQSSNLKGIDYLVPGIIAFSIMSLGLFGVSQGFVSLKSSGALRRLHVAPVNPLSFLAAQSITRLIMTALNVILMVIIGILMFDFTVRGNLLEFIIFALLGGILFLGMGFAVAGWAKDENQAAPISNIVFFPMMFLSGTFFPREVWPDWLRPVTDFMPLSYVGDGLREIANSGMHLWNLGPELAGIAVWTVIVYLIAVKVFRWD